MKYLDEFHDGALIDIQQNKNEVVLSIESAEMDVSDMKGEIQLSERSTIKGKLHLNGVQSIRINDVLSVGFFKMNCDSGKIIDLKISKNMVKIAVSWVNYPPKPSVNDFSSIEIVAEKIWWENVPDLVYSFW